MISTVSQHLCTALLGVALLSSCSRPVAYFQKGPAQPAAVHNTPAVALPVPVQTATAPIEPFTQVNATIHQVEALVRNDSKLLTNKKLSARMDRVKHLLASTHGTLVPTANTAPRKMNIVERLMLKKMNKKIGQRLAPNHPEKAMVANRIQLIGGIILLIGGLVLLIAGTGTAAFIGLIIALIGALGLILGLFGG